MTDHKPEEPNVPSRSVQRRVAAQKGEPMPDFRPRCVGCNLQPHEIEEYVEMGDIEEMTAEQFVISEEGTYNRQNGHFYCTVCYSVAGMPLGVAP